MTFYMAQETKALKLDGTNFLVHKGIKQSIKRKISYFDFGGSTLKYDIQNMGVSKFKESFGATSVLRDSFEILI